ncbi:pyridoxal 5'-phosphate synthase glutaminase subunit PdxT [Micropruina sp.]|uniref:pyridoxal 5'-phosphate synthase glutaminase subunit PdxT n=1 Tax=Micropruina sp. TaxID=2737536 RepID=UPI0039E437F8
MVRIGVLAVQGGVREHADLLAGLGVEPVLVRRPDDLARVDALVLPGGESSVIDRLARSMGLAEPLRRAIAGGLPTLATCAGLIMLADGVLDPAPGQQSLRVLDVDVRRNAFGPQVASAEVRLATAWGPAAVAFIRAPAIERVGPDVNVLAEHAGRVVAVASASVIALACHPELTGEELFHRRLLDQASRLAHTG